MLLAILIASGVIRLGVRAVPAVGRSAGSLAYAGASAWSRVRGRGGVAVPVRFRERAPLTGKLQLWFRSKGQAISTFFSAISSFFSQRWNKIRFMRTARANQRRIKAERLGANRLRSPWTPGGMWDRVVLRRRLMRARMTERRGKINNRKRYWQLWWRNLLPWKR